MDPNNRQLKEDAGAQEDQPFTDSYWKLSSDDKLRRIFHLKADSSARTRRAAVAPQDQQVTMGQKREKHRENSHLIIHYPTSEEVSEVSERAKE